MKDDNEKTLESGYAFDPNLGATYHFEHIPYERARDLIDLRDMVYIIETINSTYADKKGEIVHYNKYYTLSLPDAIALTARMQIDFEEVGEEIVCIRLASEDEANTALKILDYFESKMPEAISEKIDF